MGRKYRDFLRHQTAEHRYAVVNSTAPLREWHAAMPGKLVSLHPDVIAARKSAATAAGSSIFDRWTGKEVK